MTGREMDPEKAKLIDIELWRRDLQESIDKTSEINREVRGSVPGYKPIQYLRNKTEARMFLRFLGMEAVRHKLNIEDIERDMDYLCLEWNLGRPRMRDPKWISVKNPRRKKSGI